MFIPKFITYQIKIFLKKIKPISIDFDEISRINKNLQIDMIDSDFDSKDYIVLYCAAKKFEIYK